MMDTFTQIDTINQHQHKSIPSEKSNFLCSLINKYYDDANRNQPKREEPDQIQEKKFDKC